MKPVHITLFYNSKDSTKNSSQWWNKQYEIYTLSTAMRFETFNFTQTKLKHFTLHRLHHVSWKISNHEEKNSLLQLKIKSTSNHFPPYVVAADCRGWVCIFLYISFQVIQVKYDSIKRWPGKFPDGLESFQMAWKVSRRSGNFPDCLETFHMAWKVSIPVSSFQICPGKFPDDLKSSPSIW